MRMSPKLTLTVLPLKPTGSSHHADMLQVRVKPGHMTPKKKKNLQLSCSNPRASMSTEKWDILF